MTLYTHQSVVKPLGDAQFSGYLQRLPEVLRPSVLRYKKWEDQHTALLGKVLLQDLLHRFGYPTEVLADLQTGSHGKPFIDDRIDFNVAHSGGLVVVGISDETRLGIDVEKIRPVSLEEVRSSLRPDEYEFLRGKPEKDFFEWWTRKESLAKGLGIGLTGDFNGLRVTTTHGNLQTERPAERWWYHALAVPPGYVATLCLQKKGLKVTRIEPV